MKYIILSFIISLAASAAILPDPRVAKYDNLHPIEKAFEISSAVVYKNATISSSTDPFAGKTNKYAETGLIMVVCTGNAAHIKFGSSAPTATVSDFPILQNTPTYFKIDNAKAFVAIIQDAATAVCYTVEVY